MEANMCMKISKWRFKHLVTQKRTKRKQIWHAYTMACIKAIHFSCTSLILHAYSCQFFVCLFVKLPISVCLILFSRFWSVFLKSPFTRDFNEQLDGRSNHSVKLVSVFHYAPPIFFSILLFNCLVAAYQIAAYSVSVDYIQGSCFAYT